MVPSVEISRRSSSGVNYRKAHFSLSFGVFNFSERLIVLSFFPYAE
jgi:hypothetical protein